VIAIRSASSPHLSSCEEKTQIEFVMKCLILLVTIQVATESITTDKLNVIGGKADKHNAKSSLEGCASINLLKHGRYLRSANWGLSWT
jgi:hypothetical protein